jgi:hypothetical protein
VAAELGSVRTVVWWGTGRRNADDLTTLVARAAREFCSVFVFLSPPRGWAGWLRRGGLAVAAAAAAVRSVTCVLRERRDRDPDPPCTGARCDAFLVGWAVVVVSIGGANLISKFHLEKSS